MRSVSFSTEPPFGPCSKRRTASATNAERSSATASICAINSSGRSIRMSTIGSVTKNTASRKCAYSADSRRAITPEAFFSITVPLPITLFPSHNHILANIPLDLPLCVIVHRAQHNRTIPSHDLKQNIPIQKMRIRRVVEMGLQRGSRRDHIFFRDRASLGFFLEFRARRVVDAHELIEDARVLLFERPLARMVAGLEAVFICPHGLTERISQPFVIRSGEDVDSVWSLDAEVALWRFEWMTRYGLVAPQFGIAASEFPDRFVRRRISQSPHDLFTRVRFPAELQVGSRREEMGPRQCRIEGDRFLILRESACRVVGAH